eukprot:PDM61582.1 hypothetical protein PRIPAC_51024 [Pristionchus pacificus]
MWSSSLSSSKTCVCRIKLTVNVLHVPTTTVSYQPYLDLVEAQLLRKGGREGALARARRTGHQDVRALARLRHILLV